MTEARPSPNIWQYPDIYEQENRGVDPDGLIERTMQAIRPWEGADLVDIGCGSGYHLPRFARLATRVTGVEPHPPLVARARQRVAHLDNVDVLEGLAQELPIPTASADIVHARWAYFFGPGSEPGIDEIERVLRPGGVAFVIDNDATSSTFGGWFRRQWPAYDPAAVERFWRRRGWRHEQLTIRWEQPTRADFEAVIGIEFDPVLAKEILREHPGSHVDYAVSLWWRRA